MFSSQLSTLSTTGHNDYISKFSKTRQALDSTIASTKLPSGKKKFLFSKKNASIAMLKKTYVSKNDTQGGK